MVALNRSEQEKRIVMSPTGVANAASDKLPRTLTLQDVLLTLQGMQEDRGLPQTHVPPCHELTHVDAIKEIFASRIGFKKLAGDSPPAFSLN